ncbi:TrmH family RNA methyltransferase [Patescibacteria group bacterium]|nr:TrmH family RNA methyltransferase [Patescibacteria group bacterium]
MRVLHVIANDIRSRENTGALFRTCEFLGATKLWLTGYTPAPPDTQLLKVSLGSETSLDWERVTDVRVALGRLKEDGFELVALELTEQAEDLSDVRLPDRVALLLGNEVTGITPSLLALCDRTVMIARKGTKESLNVSVAAGIAIWKMMEARS